MSAPAVENDRHVLACLDEVLDAPTAERAALIRSRFGADARLVRDLERLLAAAESGATFLEARAEIALEPVLSDLETHSVPASEVPAGFTTALAPRYSLLERIGNGGMATVYLAFDTALGRNVAIKTLRSELTDGISKERFEREITIAASIDHPRVVPVYDRGEADGRLYYVMRYVEGGSLRDLLIERPQLEIRRAIDIARDIADALDAAHVAGIVHRDIKPANILLDKHGAHLADFGVARLIDAAGRDHLTRTGIALGTAAYMSPEQVTSAAQVNARSDVYALACVVYEMLAGEAPFTGPTQREVMSKHLAAAIPDLTVVRATVTRPMQSVIARALQKASADRYPSADAFVDAFERAYLAPDDTVEASRTVKANPVPSVAAKLRLLSRRRRFVTLAISAVAMLLVPGFGMVQSSLKTNHALAPKRVVVAPLSNRTGNEALDRVGEIAADWITGGLQRTGLVDVVPNDMAMQSARGVSRRSGADPVRALAIETRAGIVVAGSYYQQGNRLLLQVHVTDAVTGSLIGTPESADADAANPMEGIVALRNRLMGWLGLHFDDRIRGHERVDETPPTYAAYLSFSEGMSQYTITRNDAAVRSFLRAYQLDSTFVLSLLYASIGLTNLGEYAKADSILQIIGARRDRLSEYHRAWLDSRVAFLNGDNEAVLTAIRQAAQLAPESKAVYNQAVAAFQAGYMTEARTALERLPVDRGPMRGFLPYWDLRVAIAHVTGDFGAELRIGRESVKRFPGRLAPYLGIVRALAARGDTRALEAALRDAQRVPAEPAGGYHLTYGSLLAEAAKELAAHGHGIASRMLHERALGWHEANDEKPADMVDRAKLEYAMGRWTEARRLVDSVLLRDKDNEDAKGLLGSIAANLGETRIAREIAIELAADRRPYRFGVPTLYRSKIASALGDADSSLILLRQALKEGKDFGIDLHRDPDLASIPTYAAIVRGR